MSFLSMKAELAEAIPGMSRIYAGKLINRAWRRVRDGNLWSFQLQQGGLASPGIVTAGFVTVPSLPSPPVIIGDATATAAWNALVWPPITSYQFRVNGLSIYSILAYDTTTNAPFGTLLLDRPFVDPVDALTGQGYQLFQAYYPAPTPTFKRWLSVMDQLDGIPLDISSSRRDVNLTDPQRFQVSNPTVVLAMGTDQRQGTLLDGITPTQSATFGWQLFELWPNPTSEISYMTWYVDGLPDLVSNSDTVPQPMTEDAILVGARAYAYEWAEARKDVMAARGSGANYTLLKKLADEEFRTQLKPLRLTDRDRVDAFMQQIPGYQVSTIGNQPYYNTVNGRASMGWPWR